MCGSSAICFLFGKACPAADKDQKENAQPPPSPRGLNRNEQRFNLPSSHHPSPQNRHTLLLVSVGPSRELIFYLPLGKAGDALIPLPRKCQQGPVELSLQSHPAVTRLKEAVQSSASWHYCPSTPVSVCRTLWGPESSSHPAATR